MPGAQRVVDALYNVLHLCAEFSDSFQLVMPSQIVARVAQHFDCTPRSFINRCIEFSAAPEFHASSPNIGTELEFCMNSLRAPNHCLKVSVSTGFLKAPQTVAWRTACRLNTLSSLDRVNRYMELGVQSLLSLGSLQTLHGAPPDFLTI